ncbi:LacI family DNA-binding transcriptional regulator [Proteiniclasticum sp. C24MP]|uniref:LacI family DNA-binding transcriptional regulator n=1 Tax=Proteiniclasticum sp. C24MP TaxID=3374101 RepID=UPI003754592C
MPVTMKHIAELCGVSIATVSKIVNGKYEDVKEETRLRVLKTVEEEGYFINTLARSMKTKNTKTLGLIVPDIKNAYYTDISRGAEDMAIRKGYSLFLCNTDDSIHKEISYLVKLMEKQVDGIIIIASMERDIEMEALLKINVPFAVLNDSTNYSDFAVRVQVDDHMGMYEGVEHLISLGHKKIMYLQGETNLSFGEERLGGYRDALEEHGIPFDENLVATSAFNVEGAYEYLRTNGLVPETTAIVCGNDLMALGVLNWAKEECIDVPGDLSIIGFDDTIFSIISSPKITTINQNCHLVGEILVKELLEKIDAEDTTQKKIPVETHLVVRESTGKAMIH